MTVSAQILWELDVMQEIASSLVLRASGSNAEWVPRPGDRLYSEYMICSILLAALSDENQRRDPNLCAIINVRFQYSEFFGISWYMTTKPSGSGANSANTETGVTSYRSVLQSGQEIYGQQFQSATEKKIAAFIAAEQARKRCEVLEVCMPQFPMTEFDHRSGKDPQLVFTEKSKNRAEMQKIAEGFSGTEKSLIEAAIDLAFTCHFNHFRKGPGTPHYSIHLLEVARRTLEYFDETPGSLPEYQTLQGRALDPKAIAVAVALLHDAVEDLEKSFVGKFKFTHCTDRPQAADFQAVARKLIQERLSKAIDARVAKTVLEMVECLTHAVGDDFPTTGFINQARASKITLAVRLSDIDHNLSTSPNYAPMWASIVLAAQCLPLAIGTSFEQRFKCGILACLSAAEQDELLPWARCSGANAIEAALSELKDREGIEALHRVYSLHQALEKCLSTREFDLADLNLNADKIRANISAIRLRLARIFEDQPIAVPADSAFEVKSITINNVPLRVLGPVTAWTQKIFMPGDRYVLSELRLALEATVRGRVQPIAGFARPVPGGYEYVLSRIPDRAELAVPAISVYEANATALYQKLRASGMNCELLMPETASRQPLIRAVIGLTDRFLDNQRLWLLNMIVGRDFDMDTAQRLITEALGDPKNYFLDPSSVRSIAELRQTLRSLRCLINHPVREAERAFDLGQSRVEEVCILAARPSTRRLAVINYEEQGILVTSANWDVVPACVAWADKTRQTGFSVEQLQSGEAYRVELPAYIV